MREFFGGWKRRVGVLTLVMACMFLGMWIRGLTTFDRVTFAGRDSYSVFHFSNQRFGNGLGVFFYHGRITDRNYPPHTEWISHTYEYTSEQIQQQIQAHNAYKSSAEAQAAGYWSREVFGFLIGGTDTSSEMAIPYWSIVIPLTLISFCLLLSKPVPSTQKQIDEPIREMT